MLLTVRSVEMGTVRVSVVAESVTLAVPLVVTIEPAMLEVETPKGFPRNARHFGRPTVRTDYSRRTWRGCQVGSRAMSRALHWQARAVANWVLHDCFVAS